MSDTWPSRCDLVLARDADTVGAWVAALGSPRFVAVDCETSGWDPWHDDLRTVQVCAGPDRPVLVLDATAVDPRALAPLLGSADVLKVFHHGAFDLRFLWRAGLDVVRVADTMLAQRLLEGGAVGGPGAGLQSIARFRLGVELDKAVRETFAAGGALTDAQVQYGAEDAAATWGVFAQQWRELVGHGLVRVARIEFEAMPALAALQHRGAGFDPEAWRTLVAGVEERLPELEDAVQRALVTETSPRNLFGPEPVNLESPEQVKAALERVGVDVDTTRESVLSRFAAHPAVAALLEYREVNRVAQAWGGDWADRVASPATGRVHADWRQIVGTGRMACSEPNLTQVPKDPRYRACFPAGEGRALVVADYSQQELRILAAVSGDHAMASLFRAGADLHRSTASLVFGVPLDAVSSEQRAAAKALNFGLVYGMGAPAFARSTKTDLATAKATIERYFGAFPSVAAWLRDVEQTAKRTGRVRTPLGRIRVLDAAEAGSATLARNAPIQGAGADMTKRALGLAAQRIGARFGADPGAPVGPTLVVHDELVVEVPTDDALEAAAIVEDAMVEAAADVLRDVPAAVDVDVRPAWGVVPVPVGA